MQAAVEWVPRIFGTPVTRKKRPVRPVFPDYLSVSYDYGLNSAVVSFDLEKQKSFNEGQMYVALSSVTSNL